MGTHAEGTPSIEDMDEAHLGPKMRALNAAQRRFVDAALSFPTGKGKYIARAAGYAGKNDLTLRVTAHRLFHDERIIAAMHEEAGKRLRGSAALGVSVMAKIARTDGHKDQLKAAEALLNRIGFHETTEHKVTVDHGEGGDIVQRIKDAAALLGVDPGQLLGANTPVLPMKVIEHQEKANEVPVRPAD